MLFQLPIYCGRGSDHLDAKVSGELRFDCVWESSCMKCVGNVKDRVDYSWSEERVPSLIHKQQGHHRA